MGKDRSHLKLTLLEGETLRGGIGFGLGDMAEQNLGKVDVLFCPSRNEYNGRVSPQIMVQAMEPAGESGENGAEMSEGAFFLAGLQEMGRLAARKRRTSMPN